MEGQDQLWSALQHVDEVFPVNVGVIGSACLTEEAAGQLLCSHRVNAELPLLASLLQKHALTL